MKTLIAIVYIALCFSLPLLAIFDLYMALCAVLATGCLAILFFYRPRGSQ